MLVRHRYRAQKEGIDMPTKDVIAYHSNRAKAELDLGLTADVMAASRAHLQLAGLHMQRLRELTRGSGSPKPILMM